MGADADSRVLFTDSKARKGNIRGQRTTRHEWKTKQGPSVHVGPHTGTVPVLALGPKILPVVELGVFLPVVAPCLNGVPSSRTGTPSSRTGTETKVQF